MRGCRGNEWLPASKRRSAAISAHQQKLSMLHAWGPCMQLLTMFCCRRGLCQAATR